MTDFLGKDFLLTTDTAKKLYHEYASSMPIADYHCHVNPREIYENVHFENITQIWLGGDHYKWRLMRSNGVDEYYITGDAPDYEKFLKFAQALPYAIGNPMYHWCHLELKTYFGFEGALNGDTAKQVWDLANEKLKTMGVRDIIEMSNVAFIGTTDDPADSLEWHKKIADEGKMKTIVAPSFRPDKAVNIDKAGWAEYIQRLSDVCGVEIKSIADLKSALKSRIDLFDSHNCRASDHGLDKMVFNVDYDADTVMKKALCGESFSSDEADAFKTELITFCAGEYTKRGWVMQLHFNCLRNPNSVMFEKLGADTGFDVIGPNNCLALAKLLDHLNKNSVLPRTILYSLDSGDNEFLASLIGAFQGTEVQGKLQHGSAWWFNDNKTGMQDQLISLANLSILGNFIGMLTDSRSFLSYTRHEYFRRILCELIGGWVENGEYPNDEAALKTIIEGICFNNAKRYFRLEEK